MDDESVSKGHPGGGRFSPPDSTRPRQSRNRDYIHRLAFIRCRAAEA